MMKPKHILLIIFCLSMGYNAEAQFFKKLKKKAQDAAERTTLRKTDEVVTNITEQAVDSVTTKKSNKNKKNAKKNADSSSVTKNPNLTLNLGKEVADIQVQNSVQPRTTNLGGSVTFIIVVNNKGPAQSEHTVSKIEIPSSYMITSISVSQGTYDQSTNLWAIGTLSTTKRAEMTVLANVLDDSNLMTRAELVSCSTQDPNSTPNNGIDTNGNGQIIDDEGDEDDGDGQDVLIGELVADRNNGNNGKPSPNKLNYDTDVKMILEQKRDKIISFLDFDTMAMRMEYHSKGKNPDPVYWDKDGYIYSGEKGQYYKIPFEEVKNMGKNMVKMFSMGSEGMPGATVPKVRGEVVDLEWPNEPIMYNGYELHVYPNRYPMIEWVFIYHPDIFRGAYDVTEEVVNCRGASNCTKFTSTAGDEAGTTILFDHKDRLAEINNPDGASAIYSYEPCTVTLPAAKEFNFNFRD